MAASPSTIRKREGKSSMWCSVPQCATGAKNETKIHFHSFPQDVTLRAKWVQAIKRQIGPTFEIKQGCTFVCSKHFLPTDYKYSPVRTTLRPEAVPSVFAWKPVITPRPLPQKPGIHIENKAKLAKFTSDLRTPPVPAKSTSNEADQHMTAEQELIHLREEIKKVKGNLNKIIDELKIKILDLENKLKIERFGLERFSTDDALINFYTGFSNYKILSNLFECLKPSANTMTRQYYVPSQTISLAGRPRALNLIDEFFMFLVRLKLGLFEQDIAQRFNITQQSVSRNIITWANFLYFTLGSLPIWLSRDQVKHLMPTCFRMTYPTTRVILDATEIKTQYASSLVLATQLYSHYKSSPTFKCLIGIAPHGAVTFVSPLYSGNISDVEITKQSGILDLLEPGDGVMADKGFTIEKLVNEKGATLNIPPFLRNKGQFSEEEVRETEQIASVRIHVERAIRRIKEYHLFDSPIPLTIAGTINQLWAVACLLSLFKGPLIVNSIK